VRPETQDGPTFGAKGFADAAVAFDVAADLGFPIVGVGRRGAVVVAAGVPETTVDENSDLLAAENDVRGRP
jgi:hypothetical protein